MTSHVQPEQTVCLKSLPKSKLDSTLDAIRRLTSPASMSPTPDRDPARAGQFLLYANYTSPRDAQRARDAIAEWATDKFPDRVPSVFVKSEMTHAPYFAVFVASTPPGTASADVEGVFAPYGRLHDQKRSCTINADQGTFFVNFAEYEGAVAALNAARRREVRLHGSILVANPALNTMFINEILSSATREGVWSFSLDDAKRVGESMHEWAPQPAGIDALLRAIRTRFVFDRKVRRFHIVDARASMAPVEPARAANHQAPSPPRPASPDPATPKEKKLMRARLVVIDQEMLHENIPILVKLFQTLWFEAKGSAWEDSVPDQVPSSGLELQEDMYLQTMPAWMLKPIQDWDLTSVTGALMVPPLRAQLMKRSGATAACAEAPTDGHAISPYRVLVQDNIVTHDDLQQKFGPAFLGAQVHPVHALKTIRFLRNILSHLGGTTKGLSPGAFTCLYTLASDSFRTLVRMLGDEDAAEFEERCAQSLASLDEEATTCGDSRCLSDDGASEAETETDEGSSFEGSQETAVEGAASGGKTGDVGARITTLGQMLSHLGLADICLLKLERQGFDLEILLESLSVGREALMQDLQHAGVDMQGHRSKIANFLHRHAQTVARGA